MPAKEKDITFFDKVDILVHPFFALENIIRKGSANTIRNASAEDARIDYALLGLTQNWKERIDAIAKDPHGIMILFGLKVLERPRKESGRLMKGPYPKAFEGKLGANKLNTLNKEYQEFLHYAKKTLGKRLVYVTQKMSGNKTYFKEILLARRLAPSKRLRMAAYGEYFDMCVKVIGTDAMRELVNIQTKRWGQKARSGFAFVHKGDNSPKSKSRGYYSMGNENLSAQELAREAVRTKGNLSIEFVKKRLLTKHPERWQPTVDKYNLTATRKIAQAQRIRHGKK